MSGRYLALLALVAALVLAAGLLARRFLVGDPEASLAPPSEAATLQQLSQEAQLHRMTDFLASRAAGMAPSITYVPQVGASGVRWSADTVITTLPGHPLVVTLGPADVQVPDAVIAGDSVHRGWVAVVGRTPAGDILSLSATSAGRVNAQCDGVALETYVLDVALAEPLAGAGVFTLDGRLLGIVAHCGHRLTVVAAAEVERTLAR